MINRPANTLPDIAMNNQDGTPIRLNRLRGQNVVLFSFPASTGASARQMILIQRLMDRFASANAVVFGVSALKTGILQRLHHEHQLNYDLLCDADGQVLRAWDMENVKVLGVTLPSAQCGYIVLDESGYVLESGSHIDPETSVEKALRAVKIHAAMAVPLAYSGA